MNSAQQTVETMGSRELVLEFSIIMRGKAVGFCGENSGALAHMRSVLDTPVLSQDQADDILCAEFAEME